MTTSGFRYATLIGAVNILTTYSAGLRWKRFSASSAAVCSQHVQPPVAEPSLTQGEGLGAESAQKTAGDDAVLIVPRIF